MLLFVYFWCTFHHHHNHKNKQSKTMKLACSLGLGVDRTQDIIINEQTYQHKLTELAEQ